MLKTPLNLNQISANQPQKTTKTQLVGWLGFKVPLNPNQPTAEIPGKTHQKGLVQCVGLWDHLEKL